MTPQPLSMRCGSRSSIVYLHQQGIVPGARIAVSAVSAVLCLQTRDSRLGGNTPLVQVYIERVNHISGTRGCGVMVTPYRSLQRCLPHHRN